MSFLIADRVKETTTTTGTGTVSLAGAVSGFDSFSAGIGNGNNTYYCISAGAEWEVGIGTYTAAGSTLSRDTVLSSSNADALVSFSAGTKYVFCTAPAGKLFTEGTLNAATSKSTPVDADVIGILDSAASYIIKKLTWANLKATLASTFASLNGATFTGPINEARGTVAMHATTMGLWAKPNTIDGTGSAVTITAIANAPQAGAKRTLYPVAGTVITNGATFAVDGAANYTTAAGDALEFEAVTTSTYKVHITKQSGDSLVENYFYKSDIQSVAFTKTGAGTAAIKAGTKVAVASTLQTFATDTSIVMPTLTAGTDYAIYVCTDGTIRADASFSAPTGYTTANSRQIGGFHYAPGGNAAAQAGGNTTPAINEYSIWDLKFRPACADPRGMALIAGSFWADIYLLGVDYLTNGSSKYNVSIADGSAPPKRSTLYGGNGTTTYADGNWWNLNEALKHVGKRSPTYSEFAAFAYGTTEATSSGGTDVPTTGVTGTGATSAWNLFTSKFGIIQASGCMWIWGDEFGGGAAAAGYVANTQGRGSTYQMENAMLLGGSWGGAANAGSRCSLWNNSAAYSDVVIGARGVSDHLCII